jgi:hypothetical protein
MVEFVVGTPILFFIFYAICELGHVFIEYSTLVDSARNADRYLASNALYGSTGVVVLTPFLVARTRNLAVYGNALGFGRPLLPGLAADQVTVFVDAGNNVSVSLSYPYQSIVGGSLPFFVRRGSIRTNDITLKAYTSMEAL